MPTFFPRCYDLSDQKHIDSFIEDFQTTAILCIIKQYAEHFRKTTPRLEEYLAEYLTKDEFHSNKVFKQNFRLKCATLDQEAQSLLGNDMLRFATLYCRQQIVKRTAIDTLHNRRFSDEEVSQMVEFSQQLWEQGVPRNDKFPIYEQVKTLALHRKLVRHVP